MENRKFDIYNHEHTAFFGDLTNGCLHLESDVDGDDDYPGGEKHYSLTREDTERLFSIISLEDFILFCKENGLLKMEEFLQQNGLCPNTTVI